MDREGAETSAIASPIVARSSEGYLDDRPDSLSDLAFHRSILLRTARRVPEERVLAGAQGTATAVMTREPGL
jgi:hypothetical protein